MGRRYSRDVHVESSLSEALLFATMCIIGFPVDVHVRDGSIYSGIFHSAGVDDDYGVVLKNARATKKGNHNANVGSGDLIETLKILSEDLVQVVAKGILLPENGIAYDDVGDNSGSIPSLEGAERGVKVKKSNKTTLDRVPNNHTRALPHIENVTHGVVTPAEVDHLSKTEDRTASGIHSVESKVIEEIHQDMASKKLARDAPSHGSASSVVRKNNHREDKRISENGSFSDTSSLDVSTSAIPVEHTTKSHVLSSAPAAMVRPKSSSLSSMESKLNPGAKAFSPALTNQRSSTPQPAPTTANLPYIPSNQRSAVPQAVTTVANAPYIPEKIPVLASASVQPEVGISPFVPRPVKYVPYSHLTAGNGITDSQYSQPLAHIGGWSQPSRYATQHHHIQTGPAYMHNASSQNVMIGRMGQFVYVHPVSHDMNQGVAAVSQVSPMLTLHHGLHSKHQGNMGAQPMQFCLTPPFIDGGQPQYAMQNHIPLPPPSFPIISPIPLPRSNGNFMTKYP